MITDLTLQKLAFQYAGYDNLISAIHYNFTHPTKGKFTATMPDKYSKVEIDSMDFSVNLVFENLHELKEWIQL
ncbi:hypothetical protein TPENAI_30362 [Tenacibaculum litopenaei]|uniref:hypothetical protein n=1 Tax=Tenacibaculum litopenaei TaxID=396016 RepID=UPI003893CA50